MFIVIVAFYTLVHEWNILIHKFTVFIRLFLPAIFFSTKHPCCISIIRRRNHDPFISNSKQKAGSCRGKKIYEISAHYINYAVSYRIVLDHIMSTWWRHQMETLSALLAMCAGNSPVPGEFPAQRPVTRSFDVFFDLHLNKRLSKQSWGWWFETLSCPLWRHCNEHYGHNYTISYHTSHIMLCHIHY